MTRSSRSPRVPGAALLPAWAILAPIALAAQPTSPARSPFVSVDTPVVALTHAMLIDGTGSPAASDQTIVIDHGSDSRRRSVGQHYGPRRSARLRTRRQD